MAPQGEVYNVDWIFSNTSNVHVAKDLGWFTKYTPFPSNLGHLYAQSSRTAVLGIGEVELEVKRTTGQGRARKPCRKLILKEVLYAPSFMSNVAAGVPLEQDENCTWVLSKIEGESKITNRSTGATISMLDTAKLWKLWLKGQPKGMTSTDKDGLYYINATWSDGERARWQEFNAARAPNARLEDVLRLQAPLEQRPLTSAEKLWLKLDVHKEEDREQGRAITRALISTDDEERAPPPNIISPWQLDGEQAAAFSHVFQPNGRLQPGASIEVDTNSTPRPSTTGARESATTSTNNAQRPPPPGALTDQEKRWLKDHYGGEWKFLRAHGLSMHKDEDREEGRRIMRAFMVDDDSSESDDGGENDDDSEQSETNQFLRDLEEDPMSHVGDYHFTSEQLDWIEKHYRHSGEFLISYGLKAYDDEDCKEGRSIVESMMRDDDD